MLINLKIHSAFQKYFDQEVYKVDAFNAESINEYLRAVHPKFSNYISKIESGDCQESYSLVDSKFRVIENDAFGIKKFKEGDTVHLAPLVVGGGGKRGTMLLLMAFAVFAGSAIAGALSGGAAAGSAASLGMGGATGNLAASGALGGGASGGFFAGLGKAFGAMPSFMRSIVGNLALSAISSLFSKKPNPQQVETSTRVNGMFGSLTNTATSGTPVALHYGQVRVAGQFLSGYINSEVHGKNDVINVGDQFS